jgi:hypothetical protein
MKPSGAVAWILLVMTAACGAADPAPPAVSIPPATATSAATAAPAAPPPLAACAPWPAGPFSFVASHQGGHATHFRRLGYDDATGVVTVDDSDSFGKGGPTPRVTKAQVTLPEPERVALRRNLHSICPTPKDLKQECACARSTGSSCAAADFWAENLTGNRRAPSVSRADLTPPRCARLPLSLLLPVLFRAVLPRMQKQGEGRADPRGFPGPSPWPCTESNEPSGWYGQGQGEGQPRCAAG